MNNIDNKEKDKDSSEIQSARYSKRAMKVKMG